MNIGAMFWLLVICTAAICAPVTKDPVDLQSSYAEPTDRVDPLTSILKQILASRELFVNSEALNKNEKDDLDLILDTIEKYIEYKNVGMKHSEDGPTQAVDISSQTGSRLREDIVDFLNGNIEGLIKDLIKQFTKQLQREQRDFRDTHDRKSSVRLSENIREIEEIIETLRNAQISAQNVDKFKRESPVLDKPKEAPLVDVDVDVTKQPSKEYLYNLKTMYEKRGGLCTLIQGYSKTPIYVISLCRLGYARAGNTWEFCEHAPTFSSRLHQENLIDLLQTPVQDSEGFVYRNIYCAQCNDVTSVQAWTTKLDCDHMQSVSLSNGQDRVTLMKEFADKTMGCARRLMPAMPRMIHQCSHVDVISDMADHSNRIGDAAKTDHSPFPLSFSILMNFGFDGKTHILFTSTASAHTVSVTCRENEKWDPQFQKCRPIVCYDGYELVNGVCIKRENYDTYSNPDDISNLNDIEDPVQVILTLKNITYAEIYDLMVSGVEGSIRSNLASLFNISEERIQNITVNLVNSTGLHHKGDSIEIHRFTTPLPSKIMTTKKLEKQLYELGSRLGAGVDSTPSSLDRATKRVREYTGKAKPNTDISPEKSDERDVLIEDSVNRSNVTVKEKNDLPDKTSAQAARPRVDTKKIHTLDQSAVDKSHAEDTLDRESTYDSAVPNEFFTPIPGLSIRISFTLKPAHTNRTVLEKSVKTVVQTITDLVNNNAFMLSINGTDFQVQGVENAPSVSSMDDFCTRGTKPLLEEGDFNIVQEFDDKIGEYITIVVVNKTGARYYPGQYDLTFNIDGNVGNLNQTLVTSWAFVCSMPKIVDEKCGRVVLQNTEYKLFENKSIGFSNRIYNMSEYEYQNIRNETVLICTPSEWVSMQLISDSTNFTLACGDELIKVAIAESYLTFILGVISLICMLSVLITYGLFEKLRNLPGINTMSLTFSLFMGELVFITSGWIQPHLDWLCSAVGVLLHFLFLASFFWMNVMAYDVFMTFGNKCILNRIRNKKKYYPRYAAYAWGTPLLIVTICASIDFTEVINGVKIGYGGKSALTSVPEVSTNTSDATPEVYSIGCWIQRPVASMVAFGGPMILILLGNVVMFTKAIACIQANNKKTRTSVRKPSVKRMTGKDDVMLYVRMSTVMGFTWIFGLASSVVSAFAEPSGLSTCVILHCLGILFIVFNCSQGIFIFIAFVFNRRVYAMYKALTERLKADKHRSLTVSSSRGTLSTNLSQTSLSHIT